MKLLAVVFLVFGAAVGCCTTTVLRAPSVLVRYIGEDAKTAKHLYCHRTDAGAFECAELDKFLRFVERQQEDSDASSM